MHAIALTLCSVAFAADVRDSISTPRQYYEIIARLGSPVPPEYSRHSQVVSADGAKIEIFAETHRYAPLSKLKTIQPEAIAELVVVPCPDRPDCVLAGYQLRGLGQFVGVMTAESCVLIDVANDRVFSIFSTDNVTQGRGLGVPQAERKISEPALSAFAELLVVNIEEFPSQYGFEKQYNGFLTRFDERVKVSVTCEVSRIDMLAGRATFYLIFTGGDERERVTFSKPISDLLLSKYALPIDQYLKDR
ncbi:hypothetical protein LOC68_14460 [Blastopirellula sp. JC732]|uniref:Uncharacterized protein n=1 Tax=Blastopirellula sediminis TaxID=2894196 RepID=A0A9X1SH17_9BACT|nr:hypothetical protein [Blastopirellula sediminis]MCC9607115.1 hypothetical protein [Blastopirellula sediminis]MCC9629592.1 hypothetical protein [Blastopirellula sediminis]